MTLKGRNYIFLHTFAEKTNIKRILRPIYNYFDDLVEGNILHKNGYLRNAYPNRRCFIIGTGVSLNEIDLSLLVNEYTFGCNLIIKNKLIRELNLKFYAEIDRFPALYNYTMNVHGSIFRTDPSTYYPAIDNALTNPDALIFLHSSARRFIRKHNIFTNRNVHFVKSSSPMQNAKVQQHDLSKRITFLDGSIFFMVGTAIYMGFHELYLCGCGYTYQPVQCMHFYDSPCFPKDLGLDVISKMTDDFVNSRKVPGLRVHYMADDDKYYKPILVRDIKVDIRHKILREFAQANGAKIYNIIPDGFESPVYEKISWNSLVKEGLSQ
jgi:hypothetical protein